MNDPDNNAARAARAHDAEHRRWLIGIGISIAFGTFGAVMALLSYRARSQPPTPSSVQAAKSVSEKADPRRSRHRVDTDRR